jgi:hypothetical protein
MAGIAFAVYAQFRPVIDAGQAASIAVKFLAVTNGRVWTPDSETLSFNGNRPPYQSQPELVPKCWGFMVPVGDGYCLPYPIWRVHLIGLSPDGQCDAIDVVVDGRTGKVHQFQSADCP